MARLDVRWLVLIAALGCGDDSPDLDAFSDPEAFSREGCDASTPLSSVAAAGIWHVDFQFDQGPFVSPAKLSEVSGGLEARLFGRTTGDVRVTDTDLYFRFEFEDEGVARSRSFDACRVNDDGSLFGRFASCFDGDCIVAPFTAYPIEPLDEPVAEGMTLEGEIDWPEALTVNVRVADGIAYVVRFEDGMRIVDVSDPANPVELGHAPVALPDREIYNDVKLTVAGDVPYAIVGSNQRGAVVYDVSDPTNPVEVSAFPPPMGSNVNVHTLYIEGTRAYLANVSIVGLEIYDIADPTAPVPLGRYVHPSVGEVPGALVHDLFVLDGIVYLNYWTLGFVVLDASDDPAAPELLGRFGDYPRLTSHSSWVTTAGGRTIAVHGDEEFGSHVRIVDVDKSNASFMTEIGSYETRPEVSVHNVMAVGETALCTYYQDGLRVLDLSDPTAPVEVAHYQTYAGDEPNHGFSFYEGAIGVDYDNTTGLIYVADTHRGLLILSLDSGPLTP